MLNRVHGARPVNKCISFRCRKSNQPFKTHPSQHQRKLVLGIYLQCYMHPDCGRRAVFRSCQHNAQSDDRSGGYELVKRMRRPQCVEAEFGKFEQGIKAQKTARRRGRRRGKSRRKKSQKSKRIRSDFTAINTNGNRNRLRKWQLLNRRKQPSRHVRRRSNRNGNRQK